MTAMPDSVYICECWARDGLQGEAQFIPTQDKISISKSLILMGPFVLATH